MNVRNRSFLVACTKRFAIDLSFTPCFSWVSVNVRYFLNRLKRFREFESTIITYLKIGVNEKRAWQTEADASTFNDTVH
jgi:hypothetical protein